MIVAPTQIAVSIVLVGIALCVIFTVASVSHSSSTPRITYSTAVSAAGV
ncbi:MAG: hypothetical protein IPK18_11930 [Sphingobacteriales bacterium]|nr:MAG: hypothetical protein IPK18_11930 [Sphingobacteriales bacterium]